ncbi:unnamed protein product [Gadus morhua 'NCC']
MAPFQVEVSLAFREATAAPQGITPFPTSRTFLFYIWKAFLASAITSSSLLKASLFAVRHQPQLKLQGHFAQGLDILVQRGNIMDRLLLFALEEEVLQSLLLLEEVSYWL